MEWIESSGGPLILLSENSASEWNGSLTSDYDNACEISDYVGILPLKGVSGVVFNDEPLQTSIVLREATEFWVVRWRWAENDDVVSKYLEDFDSTRYVNQQELKVDLLEYDYYLIDAAFAGNETKGMHVKLASGAYQLSTVEFEPDDETSLLVHIFSIV